MFSGGIEKGKWCEMDELFHDGGPYYIETSPLICSANQWTDFYMITASIMKELKETQSLTLFLSE